MGPRGGCRQDYLPLGKPGPYLPGNGAQADMQTDRRMAGKTADRGWAGWEGPGELVVGLCPESSPPSWPGSPGPAQAASHHLDLRIKLEVLDGLVVLDAVFQFHYLILKLNTAPYSWTWKHPLPSQSGN